MTTANTLRTTLAAASLTVLFAACASNSTGPGPAHGTDPFDHNTLPSYTAFTDGGVTNWAIGGGELVGSGVSDQGVLLRGGTTFTDGWVETASTRADDGGLVLRFAGPTNYYLLAFRDDSAEVPRGAQNLAVYHRDGSAYNEMWNGNLGWPRGSRHTIRFEAAGSKLRVYFDGAQQVELSPTPGINDPHPYFGAGGVGVRHFGFTQPWTTRLESFTWQSTDPS